MKLFRLTSVALLFGLSVFAQDVSQAESGNTTEAYRVEPEDEIAVHIGNLQEIPDKAYALDRLGYVHLPLLGRIHVGGMTVDKVEQLLSDRLKPQLVHPDVTVSISNLHHVSITILGSVANPGLHQFEGHKRLFELISMAGGLRQDAGYKINITRRLEWGRIPLLNAVDDQTGRFSIAYVKVKSALDASDPDDNIEVKPEDIISVPPAKLIYVIGAVKRPGGFVLNENETLSSLQVISLAEGLDRFASPVRARILRPVSGSASRVEIPLNLKKIFDGKGADVPLRGNDVLMVPTSGKKAAAVRGMESVIGIGTSLTTLSIYR